MTLTPFNYSKFGNPGTLWTLVLILLSASDGLIQAQTPVSIAPNSWGLGMPMPTAREGAFIGVIGSKIYVIGGEANGAPLAINEIYDTTTNTWSTGAPLPTPRLDGASAVVNNILYTFGGANQNGSNGFNVVEAYNPATDSWSQRSPMPIDFINGFYAVVFDNIIYTVGGFNNGSGRLANVYSYDTTSDSWAALAPLQVGKSSSSVGVVGSTIISSGGLTNAGVTTDTEGYNIASNTWTTLAAAPTARQAGCFAAIGNVLYVAGGNPIGDNASHQQLDSMEAYNFATNTWSGGLPDLPNAVVVPASATVGGRLYCLGGTNNSDPGVGTIFNYVQIYQPASAPPAIAAALSASAFGGFSTVAPGSWVEIYGSNLASTTRSWAGTDFNGVDAPTSLSGTTVSIGGLPAFIDYISPGQVNAQVPENVLSGIQQIIVDSPAGTSASYSISVRATEPGLLAPSSFVVEGKRQVVALFPDGATYVLPPGAIPGLASKRVTVGQTITMYGVGFGPVTPNISAGQIVQQSNMLMGSLQVSFGGLPASLSYAGLAPGYVGLYQFNVVVPNVPANDAVPVTFTLAGVPGTQTLYIAVGNQ